MSRVFVWVPWLFEYHASVSYIFVSIMFVWVPWLCEFKCAWVACLFECNICVSITFVWAPYEYHTCVSTRFDWIPCLCLYHCTLQNWGEYIYLQPNMRADISQKNFIWPEIVHQGVSEGKLKIFGSSVARAKNFEFAQRNPLVDNFWSDKIFMTYICLIFGRR